MKNLILPPHYRLPRGNALMVRFQTFLCDADGKIERPLQSGVNLITDWGMDNLPATDINTLIDYLHVGSSTETMKRTLTGGVTVSFNDGTPNSMAVAASSNFFEAGDVNRTLKVDGVPEMLVTGFTDAQNITVKARAATWHPSYTPVGAVVSGAAGIHYTNAPTLGAEFTRFNTKDSGSANNSAEITESVSSRFNHQKIFLGDVVAGSPWTVNQIGWGTNTTNCFGKSNLASPDVVAVGKRYRVLLNVYNGFTPIDLSAQTINWGGTIGTYTCDLRMERINFPSGDGTTGAATCALRQTSMAASFRCGWFTGTVTLQTTQWNNDAGYTSISRTVNQYTPGSDVCIDASYVAGDFRRNRTFRWPSDLTITSATGLYMGSTGTFPSLTIKPTAPITKANGHQADLIFPIIWQRLLVN